MLYAQEFLLAGVLATALALAALAELRSRSGEVAPELGGADVHALGSLGRAVDAHAFPRDRLSEPDFDIAGHAHDAAVLATGRTRETLLGLADSASRSALEFLVGYNLAAGGWAARGGLRLPAAAPA